MTSNAGSSQPSVVWFAYNSYQKGIHPQSHLSGFSELTERQLRTKPLLDVLEGWLREKMCSMLIVFCI
ncbi:hypothetical protein H0255_03760 [Pectobacterium versatile]|nr:hypothetical protein [Pectobacterium versatile]